MFLRFTQRLVPNIGNACRRIVQNPVVHRNMWDFSRPSNLRNVFRDIDRQIERFERDVFQRFPLQKIYSRFIPIEGIETSPYRVNIDVRGFNPDQIHVSVKENTLHILAKMEKDAEDGSKLRQEVTREITLPDNVLHSQLKSFLSCDGVLTIEAPYEPSEKPTEIPVSHQPIESTTSSAT